MIIIEFKLGAISCREELRIGKVHFNYLENPDWENRQESREEYRTVEQDPLLHDNLLDSSPHGLANVVRRDQEYWIELHHR